MTSPDTTRLGLPPRTDPPIPSQWRHRWQSQTGRVWAVKPASSGSSGLAPAATRVGRRCDLQSFHHSYIPLTPHSYSHSLPLRHLIFITSLHPTTPQLLSSPAGCPSGRTSSARWRPVLGSEMTLKDTRVPAGGITWQKRVAGGLRRFGGPSLWMESAWITDYQEHGSLTWGHALHDRRI